MSTRFRDPAVGLYDFVRHDIAVRCPRCHAPAAVAAHCVDSRNVWLSPRRLLCPTCLHADETAGRTCYGACPHDPFFRAPLLLQTEVRGHLLWAYNKSHLTILESYVGATLRERPERFRGMTMLAKLPTWLKSAKLRPDILKALAHLRTLSESLVAPPGRNVRPASARAAGPHDR
jgi:hypothetical protein